jgi:hypothetical protein
MTMRSLFSLISAFVLATSVVFFSAGNVAYADFHCMRIHAVMGSYNGNNNIQFVELRMTLAGQSNLSGHTIQFWDGPTNTLKATFTFPSVVMSASLGDSILIATSEFNSYVTGGAADFTFSLANTTGVDSSTRLHPVQPQDGKVVFQPSPTFNCGNPTNEVDSVAYGTGVRNFGTASAPALPSDNQALRLKAPLAYPPTENSTNYELKPVSTTSFSVPSGSLASDLATPRNNGRNVLRLTIPVVGGVAEQPDAASGDAATAPNDGGDSRDGVAYGIGGGIAAATIACGAGWYIYRRRITPES